MSENLFFNFKTKQAFKHKKLMKTYTPVPQNRGSGKLRGTETIVNAKVRVLPIWYLLVSPVFDLALCNYGWFGKKHR